MKLTWQSLQIKLAMAKVDQDSFVQTINLIIVSSGDNGNMSLSKMSFKLYQATTNVD